MSNPEINILHADACAGNRAREEELFQFLRARFLFFVRQRIRDEIDVEEIVQDALLVIFREYRKMSFDISFAAWSYRVVEHRILALLKTRKREADRSSRPADGLDSLEQKPLNLDPKLKRRLLDCLQKIARNNRRYTRILNLHYQGYTTAEICAKMQLAPSNFYAILSRARSLLDYCLEKGDIK